MFRTTISNLWPKNHNPTCYQRHKRRVFWGGLVLVFLTSSLPVLCLRAGGKVIGPDQIWLHLLPVPWSQRERFVQLGAAAGSQQAALGGCSLALNKLDRRWKAKDKPACWPEAPRAEGYSLREPGCPSYPGLVPPGMIQSNAGCDVVSFIPPLGFAWGRSRCQAVPSSDASALSFHQFPRRSPWVARLITADSRACQPANGLSLVLKTVVELHA